MSLLPGWDSVEFAKTIGHDLHIVAVVVLGLLFVAEGLALVYDRHSESLGNALAALAEKQQEQKTRDAETRHSAELGALSTKLAEARQVADAAARQTLPRRLTEEQKATITKALLPFGNQRARIDCEASEADSGAYGNDIMTALRAAGWNVGTPTTILAPSPRAVGLEVSIHPDDANTPMRQALDALVETFVLLKIIPRPNATAYPNRERGVITLQIGAKPPITPP